MADKRIVIPEDATLKDVWQDVPAKLLWKFLRLIFYVSVAAFSLGSFLGPWWTTKVPQEQTAANSNVLKQNSDATRFSVQTSPADQSPISLLRQKNQVSQISSIQNQMTVDRLPDGVYGYVIGSAIEDAIRTKAAFRVRTKENPTWFEFHKVRSGLFIIGYVNHTDVVSLEDPRKNVLSLRYSLRQCRGWCPR